MAVRKKAKKAGKKKAKAAGAGDRDTAARPEKADAAKGKVSSIAVNLGHIFALRPRVSTAFPPGQLNTAKHFLRDESYATIEDAARAVAAKALELTQKGPSGKGSWRR